MEVYVINSIRVQGLGVNVVPKAFSMGESLANGRDCLGLAAVEGTRLWHQANSICRTPLHALTHLTFKSLSVLSTGMTESCRSVCCSQ